jgi:hypothetical protein
MRGNRAKRDWFAVHSQTHTLQVFRRALPAALENLIFKWFDYITRETTADGIDLCVVQRCYGVVSFRRRREKTA